MSVTYYKATSQPAFNVAVTVGLPVWETVIPAQNDKVLFRQSFMQLAASYSPLPLDTPYPAAGAYGVPTGATYYLVAEENFADQSGGMIQWERVYAKVPNSWSDGEEFAYTFPAYIASSTGGVDSTITSISESGTYYTISSSLSFNTGDSVFVSVSYVRDSISYYVGQYTRAAGGNSGSNVLVPAIFPGTGSFGSVGGNVTTETPYRALEQTLLVTSQLVHDYALTSVTAIDGALPIINEFSPVDATGASLQFNRLDTATKPAYDQYAAMVKNQVLIVGASSTRSRFYGNIFERVTRYIPAS
jgi:hypothetical protein